MRGSVAIRLGGVGGLALALMTMGSTIVGAQEEGSVIAQAVHFGPGATGGNNLVVILLAPAVQEELKMTEAQKNKVFEVAREAGRKSRDALQTSMFNSGGNPRAVLATAMQLRAENERAVVQSLNPEQKERAQQIQLRVEGPLAVAQPEIARKIGVSPRQGEEIQGVMVQLFLAQRQLALQNGGGFGPRPLSRAEAAPLRKAAVKQISSILNAKQKAAFDKLLGEPFDLSKIDPELASPSAASNAPSDAEGTPPSDAPAKSARRKRGAPVKKAAPPK